MSRIGIYGGSFDPIHLGHLLLAESAREELELDQVIFVPAKRSPFKSHHSTVGDTHRWNMLLLAMEDNPYFAASKVELDREPPSYTIKTIDYFSRIHSHAELWLILGEDALVDFHHWRQYQKLLKLTNIAVGARPGINNKDRIRLSGTLTKELTEYVKYAGACIRFFSNPLFDVSSRGIRKRIKNGRSVTYFLLPKVREYIMENKLYL